MSIQVPESCRAYCKDRAVAVAVDAILDGKSLGVPVSLEWDELPSFHRAVLAARQVQCEYAIFLHELWNAVWKPALDACDIGKKLTPRTIADTAEWCNRKPDTHTLWSERRFGQVLDIADTNLVLCPGVEIGYKRIDHERARLCLSLQDTERSFVEPRIAPGAVKRPPDVAKKWSILSIFGQQTTQSAEMRRPSNSAKLFATGPKDDVDPMTELDLGADWRPEDAEDGVLRTRKELAPIADDGSIDLDALSKAAADALAAIGSRPRD